ncbi:MAG: transglutaminase family protein [Paracoccaceae bacterium]
MLYDLSLRIRYRYRAPAEQVRQVLRVRPLDLPGVQRVVASQLSIDPAPSEWETRPDFFGNVADHIAIDTPHDVLTFRMTARVQRLLDGQPVDRSGAPDMLAKEIAAHGDMGGTSPVHFIPPSPRIAALPEVADFARDVTRSASTSVTAVEALGRALHANMRFDPSATTVSTAPLDAFRHRHGVCQDFSHVMIAGLRGIGIPAGYVSGFLRTVPPPGRERLEGADAMHAWVRAWCGAAQGWVEYDPTNACFAGPDHIVVGYGRDYGDVSPVRGSARSAGGHSGDHQVDVIPVVPT